MTDAEWLASDNPGRMRGEIRCRSFSPLCWVWFDLGCVRRVADLFVNRRCSELVEAMDAWASDPNRYRYQSFHQEQAAVGEAERRLSRGRDDPLREARSAAVRALLFLGSGTLGTSEMVCVAAGRRAGGAGLNAAVRAERAAHAGLMRCVFRSTLAAVVCDPAWRTSTVLALAQQVYDTRDFSAMPILADALQDAGCDSDAVLSHCRSDGPHARGCWVVDLVLGKG